MECDKACHDQIYSCSMKSGEVWALHRGQREGESNGRAKWYMHGQMKSMHDVRAVFQSSHIDDERCPIICI